MSARNWENLGEFQRNEFYCKKKFRLLPKENDFKRGLSKGALTILLRLYGLTSAGSEQINIYFDTHT